MFRKKQTILTIIVIALLIAGALAYKNFFVNGDTIINSKGIFYGNATDIQGIPLSGKAFIKRVDNTVYSAIINKDGEFAFLDVPFGGYSISFFDDNFIKYSPLNDEMMSVSIKQPYTYANFDTLISE